ncbi:transporter [Longimicrobium sp.]|uniref:transporter n=1 Tax=Longimicrobium sp. TaxID=2029185 RepID=UPI003B3A0CDE
MKTSILGIAPLIALLAAAPALCAQGAAAPAPISDNSFLIEEAYNQESGVVQHISAVERAHAGGAWGYGFTQEWPLFGLKHQISYTIPVVHPGGGFSAGIGDVSVDYRYQLVGDASSRLAVAPRLSLLLPTGDRASGRGGGRTGVEGALPVSAVLAPVLVAHSNASLAWFPDDVSQLSLAQSVVWLAHPRANLLVEAAWEREDVLGQVTESLFVSPGVRAAFDVGRVQVVPGLAVPMGVGASSGERMLFLYLSLEHAYRR